MAKKCTEKCDARAKLLFRSLNLLFFYVLFVVASLYLKVLMEQFFPVPINNPEDFTEVNSVQFLKFSFLKWRIT